MTLCPVDGQPCNFYGCTTDCYVREHGFELTFARCEKCTWPILFEAIGSQCLCDHDGKISFGSKAAPETHDTDS